MSYMSPQCYGISLGWTYSYRAITDGPCRSSLSAHLAKSSKDPRVLLLGAGKAHNSVNHYIPGDRFTFASTNAGPQFNYRFKGAPELGPKGRELVYDRGSGLGGSSNINFAVWDYVRKGEMDEWVRQVGDNIWNYKSQLQKMKKVRLLNLLNIASTPSSYRSRISATR
ncbi:hypothetical protein V8C35DRAFT_60757 [Trichoderma chlorosporum]